MIDADLLRPPSDYSFHYDIDAGLLIERLSEHIRESHRPDWAEKTSLEWNGMSGLLYRCLRKWDDGGECLRMHLSIGIWSPPDWHVRVYSAQPEIGER